MVPVEARPSSVTDWPIWTSLRSPWMAATTPTEASSAPVITTSSVSTPPLSDVTITSAGGTSSVGMVQVVTPLATVGSAFAKPSSFRAAVLSPDCADTVSVRVSLL